MRLANHSGGYLPESSPRSHRLDVGNQAQRGQWIIRTQMKHACSRWLLTLSHCSLPVSFLITWITVLMATLKLFVYKFVSFTRILRITKQSPCLIYLYSQILRPGWECWFWSLTLHANWSLCTYSSKKLLISILLPFPALYFPLVISLFDLSPMSFCFLLWCVCVCVCGRCVSVCVCARERTRMYVHQCMHTQWPEVNICCPLLFSTLPLGTRSVLGCFLFCDNKI